MIATWSPSALNDHVSSNLVPAEVCIGQETTGIHDTLLQYMMKLDVGVTRYAVRFDAGVVL